MWSIVRNIKKFTTKSEVDKVLGEPKFQLNGRVYYYGKGMLIAYAPIRFKVEGVERIEYGEKGEYVINVYCFTDVEMLKLEFGLNDFGGTDNFCRASYGAYTLRRAKDGLCRELCRSLGRTGSNNRFCPWVD